MRWVFGLLFVFNGVCLVFGLSLLRPSAELELVAPSPLVSQAKTNVIVLLKERRLAATSEEPVENVSIERKMEAESSSGIQTAALKSQVQEAPRCFKLGPFASSTDADKFHALVGLDDGAWKIEDHAEARDLSFWVYIPPSETREESFASLRNLQMMGVDSFVVSRGEHANAISLGTFQKKESAETLREKVAAMGFNAAVQEMVRSQSKIWLYLQANSLSDQRSIQAKAMGDIQASIFSCEMFAREQILP